SVLDRHLNRVMPDIEELKRAPLELRRVRSSACLRKPLFKLRRIVAPAHVDYSNVASAKVIRYLLEVRRHFVRPSRRRLERKIGQLIVKPRHHQAGRRISSYRNSGNMRPVNIGVEKLIQVG